jgi:hypothetical protein
VAGSPNPFSPSFTKPAATSTTSGNPFTPTKASTAGSSGNPFSASYTAPAKPASGGGDFFHQILHNPVTAAAGAVSHVVPKTVTGLASDAYNFPGQLVTKIAPAFGHDLLVSIEHPGRQIGPSWSSLAHPLRPTNEHGGELWPTLVAPTIASVKESVQHPLAHPDQTLLNALALGSLGAGSLARLGAASDVAGAGAGIGDITRALVTKPEIQPRLIDVNEGQVPLQPSHAALPQAIQSIHDAIVQHAINTSPESRIARYGMGRVRGSLEETGRYQRAMTETPATRLAAEANKLPGRQIGNKLSPARTVQQAALRLTSEQRTPEEALAFHQNQILNGVGDPADHLHQIGILSKVRDQGLTKLDENGRVVIDAAKHPQLAAVDARLAAGQAARDVTLANTGQMTPEALQARINAPARIEAGGRYVAPTPGKVGRSPALDAATAERDRLAALHQHALDQEANWSTTTRAGTATKDLRGPMTTEQAAARLAELDKQHAELIRNIVPETSPYGPQLKGTAAKGEQMARNFASGKSGIKRLTVKQEEAELADAKLRQVVAASKGNPAADEVAAMLAERDMLRQQLTARGEASLEGTGTVVLPRGGEQPVIPAASNPYRNRIVQFGTRLEAAQAKVDRLAAAAAKREGPTGIVGGEAARPGRGYVPAYTAEKESLGGGRAPGGVIGKARGLISPTKTFTGENQLLGRTPPGTTGLVARQMRRAYNFLSNDALRRKVASLGSATRKTGRDALVSTQLFKSAKVPDSVRLLTGDLRSTLDPDAVAGHAAVFDTWRQQMFPHLDKLNGELGKAAQDRMGIGTEAPKGYMWVDRKMIPRSLTNPLPAPPGAFGKLIDSVNSAVTATTVYFKIGHVATRGFTDAATNIVQGSADPVSIGKSVLLYGALPVEDRDLAIASVGRGGIRAMPTEGVNLIGRVARAGASFYSRKIDSEFRFNSLAYEARKAGFDTPEKFSQMLHDAQDPSRLTSTEFAKIDGVIKRAAREAISYDRLSPFEQRYIARAIWFYPWVRGATVFAGNTILEHPLKAAALGAIGSQGTASALAALGPQPSYGRGNFALPWGGSPGLPLVANFGTLSPIATPAQVAESLIHLNRPTQAEQLLNYLNPVYSALIGAAANLNQYGQSPTSQYPGSGVLKTALQSLISSTPETALVDAFLKARSPNQSKAMYPASPFWSALRFGFGSATPRPENRAVANTRAASETKTAGR